jgi:hypothetical protein
MTPLRIIRPEPNISLPFAGIGSVGEKDREEMAGKEKQRL